MVDSAGLVLWRSRTVVELLLVHPGGPFWAKKDQHAWSIPKGEFDPDQEEPLDAARREFAEELGHPAPDGPAIDLGSFRAGSKRIHPWLVEGDLDVSTINSNSFDMEWPPKSGRIQSFPEVDRAEWIPIDGAVEKLHKGQSPVVDRVRAQVDSEGRG